MTNTDELIIINKAKQGDHESLDLLLRNYAPLVRSLARKSFLMGGDIEDLQQEGLLAIINAVRLYNPEKNKSFSSFATMCVRTKMIDAIRTATREKHRVLNIASSLSSEETMEILENSAVDGSETALDPLTIYLEEEKKTSFYENLSKLLTTDQIDLLKLYFEGYSYVEISQKMNIPLKKVDNTLSLVKRKLKKEKTLFI